MDVQSSPNNEKPTSDLNALFEELEKRQPKKQIAPSTPRPRSATSALLGSSPRRSAPPPPPPPSRRTPAGAQSIDDAEVEAIAPTYDAELDDAPTVARSSPLSLPLPSRRLAPPPSSVRLPPPAAIARLSPPGAAMKSATELPLPSRSRLPAPLPPPSRGSRPASSAPRQAISTPLPALPPSSVAPQSVVIVDHASRTPSSSIPPVANATSSGAPKRTSPIPFLAFGALALLGVAAGLGYGFKDQLLAARATTGAITVTVAGPNNAPVAGVRVLVDGSERCTSSPCQLSIAAGTHFVRAEAPGFVGTADRAVSIERNGEATLHLALSAAEPPKPVERTPEPLQAQPTPAPAPVQLAPRDSHPSRPVAKLAATPKPAESKPAADPAPAQPVVASGNGTLNINSIPVANVVLDGRPIGSTPILGLSVSAGPHTVVFVHPEQGRKATSVKVEPGKTATAAVRF
jgi:hypothetical protein